MDRVETGNMSNYTSIGGDVYELRFYFGPGYRVYYGETAGIILLLCGGDKPSQKKDIKKAKTYWKKFMSGGTV
ncbi:MAG: hypothetical protein JRJ44_02085 [Deltaproteobacteria bacterium]|nr:hypothetical protein [Deltaproteobacteria bacterium]